MGLHISIKKTWWCDRCGQVQVPPPDGPQKITEVLVLCEGSTYSLMTNPSEIAVSKYLCSTCLSVAMAYIKCWTKQIPGTGLGD